MLTIEKPRSFLLADVDLVDVSGRSEGRSEGPTRSVGKCLHNEAPQADAKRRAEGAILKADVLQFGFCVLKFERNTIEFLSLKEIAIAHLRAIQNEEFELDENGDMNVG